MVRIPTITDLYVNVLGNLETEFGGNIDPDGKSFLRAFAAVQAAKLWQLYLVLGDNQKNEWPDLADPEAAGGTLERFGRIKNINPLQGTQGQYTATVTGTNGATITSGTTWKSDDSSMSPGLIYTLDNDYTLSGTTGTITLRALTTGTSALLAVGNTLTATQPLTNVNQTATVTVVAVSPVDAETIEQYRSRVEETYVLEPQGGAQSDYRLWGRMAAGVAQIYPYAVSGNPNTVAVYVEAILSDSTDGKGTPTSTILNAVTAIMSSANGLKPLGVNPVIVNPVSIATVTITFTGSTGSPGISVVQRAVITAALIELVSTIRPFIPGADALSDRNDSITTNAIIQTALNNAPGCYFAGVTLTVNAVPQISYLFTLGEIPWLNPSVTYS